MKTSLVMLLSLLTFGNYASADSADHNCQIFITGSKIFKDRGFVFTEIKVAKALLDSALNPTVFLRVENINGVSGTKDIEAVEKNAPISSPYREFEVQFDHEFASRPHLGILAGVKLEPGFNLFDWNHSPAASFGMIYFEDKFNPGTCLSR